MRGKGENSVFKNDPWQSCKSLGSSYEGEEFQEDEVRVGGVRTGFLPQDVASQDVMGLGRP